MRTADAKIRIRGPLKTTSAAGRTRESPRRSRRRRIHRARRSDALVRSGPRRPAEAFSSVIVCRPVGVIATKANRGGAVACRHDLTVSTVRRGPVLRSVSRCRTAGFHVKSETHSLFVPRDNRRAWRRAPTVTNRGSILSRRLRCQEERARKERYARKHGNGKRFHRQAGVITHGTAMFGGRRKMRACAIRSRFSGDLPRADARYGSRTVSGRLIPSRSTECARRSQRRWELRCPVQEIPASAPARKMATVLASWDGENCRARDSRKCSGHQCAD